MANGQEGKSRKPVDLWRREPVQGSGANRLWPWQGDDSSDDEDRERVALVLHPGTARLGSPDEEFFQKVRGWGVPSWIDEEWRGAQEP